MFTTIRNIIFPRSKDLPVKAHVAWPTDPVTDTLVRRALAKSSTKIVYVSKENKEEHENRLLQWCSYTEMDHELAHFKREDVLSSSFAFRSALVEKHHLQRAIQAYIARNPSSVLADAYPHSYEIELSFADELEEMWTDELYTFGQQLDDGDSWWILKPVTRPSLDLKIFHTKEELQHILEEFDEQADEEDDEDSGAVSSQKQHFIIQKYVDNPLLLDGVEGCQPGSKFQLRVFCLANGNLQLYLYKQAIVLFASKPFMTLSKDDDAFDRSLAPHVTNPPRNPIDGNDIRLLQNLEGARITSGTEAHGTKLEKADLDFIMAQIQSSLSEIFKAIEGNPVKFQARSNAFELYAVDFLVSHGDSIRVNLVGVDAEPSFRFIGTQLNWVLDELFAGIAETAIEPFFSEKKGSGVSPDTWKIGEERHNFIKFVDEEHRDVEG